MQSVPELAGPLLWICSLYQDKLNLQHENFGSKAKIFPCINLYNCMYFDIKVHNSKIVFMLDVLIIKIISKLNLNMLGEKNKKHVQQNLKWRTIIQIFQVEYDKSQWLNKIIYKRKLCKQ